MKKSNNIKEKLIAVTTELIRKGNGNVNEITTRMIAEKAEVGIGLINYHFQTKENLIEICIQQMIGNVIKDFRPNVTGPLNPVDYLKSVAKSVADFLMENQAVARISILGDFHNPQKTDNTMKTVKGFGSAISELNISNQEKTILMFALTSILQAVFLRAGMSRELFGYDFQVKNERDMFIDSIIEHLLKD
jgi:AcrR family transcriptional regulator